MLESPTISFEFFPPKTPAGAEKLNQVCRQLAVLNPEYFSVTFGAGGSTREGTFDTVLSIRNQGYTAVPHISCISTDKAEIDQLLADYRHHGIRHLVALRGDMPSGQYARGELRYASELVEYIRATTGDEFHIEVAAYPEFHPQAVNAQADMENFVRKVNAGASSAITQYFYNIDAYLNFVDKVRAMGVDIPIVPGIMPITDRARLLRFSETCGAEVPRWLQKRLQAYGDDTESIVAFGIEVVTRLCEQLLLQGAPGLHFYALNQVDPSRLIWQNLNPDMS